MKFVACDPTTAMAELHSKLSAALAEHDNVLWLVSGGSNVKPSKHVLDQTSSEDRQKLTIALVDERFGSVGHAESNFQKFQASDFTPEPATFIPVLHEGWDLATTTTAYNRVLEELIGKAGAVICQLGIGNDCHTAGILPHAPVINSRQVVDSYQGPEFPRITLTFTGLKRLEGAMVFAFGTDKLGALTQLRDTNTDQSTQPCQILKDLADVTIYNDSLQGEV
ncbi:6-phosphogluconolactonase [Candidatus Saccharibacteria bacterium]|nr:6-phosphogluconolactonase [Candidatus Saccharibacteria bacterium]